MVNYCCVPQCKTKGIRGCTIKFHKFPDNKQMVVKWLRAIKRSMESTKYSKICGLHFTETDYKETIYSGYTKRFLKVNVVPSKNLPNTNYDTSKGVDSPSTSNNNNIKYTKEEYSQNTGCVEEDKIVQNSEMPEIDNGHDNNSEIKTMGTVYCFVPGCKNNSAKQCGLKFYCFPRDPILARLWIVKIQSGKMFTKSSRICSKHFRPNDYIKSSRDVKFLKIDAVPSQLLLRNPIKHLVLLPEPNILDEQSTFRPIQIPKPETQHATTQTEELTNCERALQTDDEPIPTETMNYDELSASDFVFFTGLKLPNFIELVECLDFDSQSNEYTKTISNYDQLTLTLIKLRHKFEFKILAKMYGIHRDIVHNIFVFWINVMFDRFMKSDLWALRDKQNSSGYTAILNCCEIPCQSNNSDFETILMSAKKKRLTIKYLVATDELGMVIFCSNTLFGGSITDRQVITQSGILDKLMGPIHDTTHCTTGLYNEL